MFKTNVGRLRILGFFEGISLIILIFVATPMKYCFANPGWTKLIGPVHGALFLLYAINALSVSVERNWKFWTTTWKVIMASFIPFGTFYIDKKILSKL
ncbi:DUF3817 domain-containing protein [Poritiphilus flavus]|nr:DUF3817 domain-containing protein [Poritiphilus flavus]